MSGLTADITARKQAEEALRQSEEQLRRHGAELELRVAERTAELSETNTVLQTEIAERKQVEAQRTQLLRRFLSVQEEERRRFSRELHDQFGQQLVALNLNLHLLKECHGEPEKLHERIGVMDSIVKQLDADVDFMAWGLRPTTLDDLGLHFALDNYVNEWSKHNNVPVQFHRDETDERLAPEIEITLYRIAQEALNNVSKHAQAKGVGVILERRESTLSLIIEDDGCGFDTSEPKTTDGKKLGLIGMRERAALVGGSVEIESQPGEGTTVVVRIPVAPASDTGETDE
jgi:signal transduction histidine kinase